MNIERIAALGNMAKQQEFDMVRRELYPSNYTGPEDAPPPEDYIKEMKASGKYTEVIQKLNIVSERLRQYGTSTR
jgi:hypothetical protein